MRFLWGAPAAVVAAAVLFTAPAPTLADCPAGDATLREGLKRDVRWLAGPGRAGRGVGTKHDRQTRRYIAERFRCLGLVPAGDRGGYQARFRTSERIRTANVIGVLSGRDPARRAGAVAVGAHHDHLGRRGKRVWPGANDNASGTAGMLAIAERLSARPEPLERPVIFVAFGAEEESRTPPHLEGSVRFLRKLPLDFRRKDIGAMVNLDMIGTYKRRKELRVIGERRGITRRAIRAARRDVKRLRVRFPGAPSPGTADAWPFYRRGIPTAFFFTPDPRCYHSPCDRPGHLKYGPMSRITRLAEGTTERLASG